MIGKRQLGSATKEKGSFMSKSALTCLVLTIACACGAYLFPESTAISSTTLKAGLGVFGVLFLITAIIGRRVKFDPVLR